MLTRMAQWLTTCTLGNVEDENERTIYEYGCELWLYTVISTIGLLIIGALLGAFLETVVMVTFFYICQSTGGGYHATTHMKCFLTMAIGLLFGILAVQHLLTELISTLLLIVSTLVLMVHPVEIHPNKEYLTYKANEFAKKSRITIAILLCCTVVFRFFFPISLYYASCIGMLCSSVSRVCGTQSHLHV